MSLCLTSLGLAVFVALFAIPGVVYAKELAPVSAVHDMNGLHNYNEDLWIHPHMFVMSRISQGDCWMNIKVSPMRSARWDVSISPQLTLPEACLTSAPL